MEWCKIFISQCESQMARWGCWPLSKRGNKTAKTKKTAAAPYLSPSRIHTSTHSIVSQRKVFPHQLTTGARSRSRRNTPKSKKFFFGKQIWSPLKFALIKPPSMSHIIAIMYIQLVPTSEWYIFLSKMWISTFIAGFEIKGFPYIFSCLVFLMIWPHLPHPNSATNLAPPPTIPRQ